MSENLPELLPEEHAKVKRGRPTKAKQPRSERQNEAGEVRSSQINAVGKVIPACPMNADELAETWSVGRDDAFGITVKVLRQVKGDSALELIDNVPLVDYSGENIAANYGPGVYYLRPASGKYQKLACKLPISDALARSCGWGRLPVTPQDVQAERTLRQAVESPTDPVDLLAAIQQMIRREMDTRGMGSTPGMTMPMQTFNPMEAMQNQMGQMQAWMGFMDTMEKQMQERVERRMGILEPERQEKTSTWEALIPVALKIFDRMTTPPAAPVQRQPLPMAAPAPEPAPAPQSKPVEAPMSNLTDDERKLLGRGIAMLRPFGGQLAELTKTKATNDQIVSELEGYIPDSMIDSINALDDACQKYGPAILGQIHPELATERWAAIVKALRLVLA